MSILSSLLAAESIASHSVYFSRFLADKFAVDEDELAVLAVALLCESIKEGHVCLDLRQVADRPIFDTPATALSLEQWQEALSACPFVGNIGEVAPLILADSLLYLHRHWVSERQVGENILSRLTPAEYDQQLLALGLEKLYSSDLSDRPDWQKLAAAQAVSNQFTVISGGPGTGKTTTVVKVLALLIEQKPNLNVRLAAPTGKAAARMVESIRSARRNLQLDPLVSRAMPDEASTIHRLLGVQGGRGRRVFRHNRDNPLRMGCLVIDEASMIDLSLMHALLEAVPLQTRLILLGDRDQLASVDAGNVLGDITGHGTELSYTQQSAAKLATLCAYADSELPVSGALPKIGGAVALLRKSHRFTANSGIGRLARLVNSGQGVQALALLNEASAADSDLAFIELSEKETENLSRTALEWAVERYSEYLSCDSVDEALISLSRTRVLCAVHSTAFGDEEVNKLIAQGLANKGLLSSQENCHGTPIMITVNDYELELYNGDIGLLWLSDTGALQACFAQQDGGVRKLPVQSLPQFSPAWALTVHKSQGSEFDQVMLILPNDSNSPLLSRELLYTGITRARSKLVLCASTQALKVACEKVVQRSSGLAALLGW
ncbi:MAG: exodeoxyribonuclease V subunit alpha [Pseudohongiellaceae bacterium]|nr:exodeoxyribonuclease V subunit alpha [Pseudohongiellaceae bacterium]